MASPADKDIPEIRWIERIANLLDSRFTFPGTKYKFGLDPIIGLIPVIGDLSGMVVSAFLIASLAKRGGSKKVIILMTLNVLLDTVIGSIPILGSIFDFGFKANTRNIRLVKEHYYEGKHQGSGTRIIIVIFILVMAIIAALLYGTYKLIAFLIGLL